MEPGRVFAWAVALSTALLMAILLAQGVSEPRPLSSMLFWLALLVVVELLPVSLGFRAEVTMALPVHLAVAILFTPPAAMLIAGVGAFDMREVRREIPLWRALFNRSQIMLAAGSASLVIHLYPGQPFTGPRGALFIALGAVVHNVVNLGLIAMMMSRHQRIRLSEAAATLVPQPIAGFWMVQVLLGALGAATAAAYEAIGAFVALFLIPLLLARLSILGARAQQELSERVRRQQQQLLEATERVFQEREQERQRIAEDIHDSALQSLASAAYGCHNATAFLDAEQLDRARRSVSVASDALNQAMVGLRESLVDLRRSLIEEGGLMETVRRYIDQVSPLWGAEVQLDGSLGHEPPAPVALAGFQILQEGLANALKHAHGSQIVVRVSDSDGLIHIVVEDKGPGFDLSAEVGEDHHGMRLMKERAARVGGRLQLDSKVGAGTRLEATLPGGVVQ